MKKTFALIVLTGLMLTGCGGTSKEVKPTAASNAVAVEDVTVPGVLGLSLDKAKDQLENLGFKVEAVDTVDGKSIFSEKNWQVTSQDPTEGARVAKGSAVHLGVKSLEKVAAEKAAADKAAGEQAAAEKAAAAAKAAADRAAADQAAAQQAAKQVPAPAAPAPAPAPVVPAPVRVAPAPAAVSYANCTAVRAAGAAPIYAGTPGYGKHLDRDGDGIGCDK